MIPPCARLNTTKAYLLGLLVHTSASRTLTQDRSYHPVLSQARPLRLQGSVPLVFGTQLLRGLGPAVLWAPRSVGLSDQSSGPCPYTNAEHERVTARSCRFIQGCFLPNHLALCICAGGNLQRRVCATRFHWVEIPTGMGHPEFSVGDTVTTLFRA